MRHHGSRVAWISIVLVLAICWMVSGVAHATGEKELRVALQLDPTTLNAVLTTTAAFQCVYEHITEQLVVFSSDGGEILPWLATDWTWVDDVTLEMKLRQGVAFTNGEPFDAEAAVFSIDQFASAKSYYSYLASDLTITTEVVDTYTIRVHLNRPYGPLLSFLARGGAVFPPKYYAEVGEEAFGQSPVGTGPFMLNEWVKDSHIELVRNPSYWGGVHPIDRITYRVIPEETARVAAVETGEVDIALMIPPSAVARLNAAAGVNAVTSPGLRKFATYFNVKPERVGDALADPRVRTALNLAVDKQAIADYLFEGAADPMPGQWMNKGEFGYNPDIEMFPYDPDRAKALLTEAGYPDGFEMQLTYTVGRYAQDKELGEVVASYLEAVGIRVAQRALEYGTFRSILYEGDLGPFQWGLLFSPEPHFAYSYLTTGVQNNENIYVSDIEDLVLEASLTADRDKRGALYQRIAEIRHENPALLFLIVPRDIYGVNTRVKNFAPRVDQVLWLFDVDVE